MSFGHARQEQIREHIRTDLAERPTASPLRLLVRADVPSGVDGVGGERGLRLVALLRIRDPTGELVDPVPDRVGQGCGQIGEQTTHPVVEIDHPHVPAAHGCLPAEG